MDRPDLGGATADALGSTDLFPYAEQYAAAHRQNEEAIEAFDRLSRMVSEDTLRLAAAVDAAMEPVRSFIQRCSEAVQRLIAARREHPDHVIDDAFSAVTLDLPSMSDEDRVRAALAAFQYCKPMPFTAATLANLTEDERVSCLAFAIRDIENTCIAHPDLRSKLATAIKKDLRGSQRHRKARLDDRLDRDACAVAVRRGVRVRLESVKKGPGASRAIENSSIADALVADYVVGLVRDAADKLRRSDRKCAAGIDSLSGDDTREEVAARHGLTERQVRRAEERVRRKFEALRRRVE
jgi:hypothetical protein